MSLLPSPGFERRTGELKVKTERIPHWTSVGVAGAGRTMDVVVGVMEKWMVQDGGAFHGHSPPQMGSYCCVTPHQPHWWCGDIWMPTWVRLKEEWRDLPAVLTLNSREVHSC